jgi:threonylcarbamoyladenosine tRNA methylthiotransferase MtaB
MSKKSTVSIRTLGCKLNQAESEALTRQFAAAGYIVTIGDKADVFILNTCSVTHAADRKARQQLRVLRKLNPEALIIATGCYAEWAGAALRDYGADTVVGNVEKAMLLQMVEDEREAITVRRSSDLDARSERTRSFVKIQDGCRNFCSYCIVPLLRCDVYSRDMDTIVAEIKERVNEGYKEAVLTGTEIGSYDYHGAGLADLIERILDQTGIERLHLSSLQPAHIVKSLLDLWKDERIIRHFHLALQSGSDKVLKRMKRRYNTLDFEEAVKQLRDYVPGASLTTDVMVGFPGESEEEFRESYDFCRRMKFSAMHVFAYSPRPGTAAAKMTAKVGEKIKGERSAHMLDLAARSADEFAESCCGQTRRVLWENEVRPGSGIYVGLTDNYIRVYASSAHNMSGISSRTRLLLPVTRAPGAVARPSTKGNHGELWGELNENQYKGHSALVKGRGREDG